MIISFAYNKRMSPINGLSNVSVLRHPSAQYMAKCHFDNVYWEFDAEHNYAPNLVFEGNISRLDAIAQKFPGNVDTVYFEHDMPDVRFRYHFSEEQMSQLAQKGFWSETGVAIPPIFTSLAFQLETNVIVEEVLCEEKSDIPILNIELETPYDNTFDEKAYYLADYIVRGKSEEHKSVENQVQIDVHQSTVDVIKEAEAVSAERDRLLKESGMKPLSEEEADMRSKSANISTAVAAARNEIRQARDEGNARAEAERKEEKARLEAEREALVNVDVPIETNVENLVNNVENSKYEDNRDIFASSDTNIMPDKVAALLKQLSAADTTDTKDGNRSDNAGAASGAQGLGVYTFEDQSTAQFAMRADEGHGNEKSSIGKRFAKLDSKDAYADKSDNEDDRSK